MRDPDIEPGKKASELRDNRYRPLSCAASHPRRPASGDEFLRALASSNDDPIPVTLALDVRFPACCLLAGDDHLTSAYIEAIVAQFREMTANLDSDRQLLRLAVSGESAACLNAGQWRQLGREFARKYSPETGALREFTFHAGTRQPGHDLLRALSESGINRLGIRLNIRRSASSSAWIQQIDRAAATVREARRAGIVSLRLGIAGVTAVADAQPSIDKAVDAMRPEVVVLESSDHRQSGPSPFAECSGDFDILGLGIGAPSRLGCKIYPGPARLNEYLGRFPGVAMNQNDIRHATSPDPGSSG